MISDTTFTSKHILLFDLRTIRALLTQSDTNFTTASKNPTYDFSAVADAANWGCWSKDLDQIVLSSTMLTESYLVTLVYIVNLRVALV
jgi:hypothetical protein